MDNMQTKKEYAEFYEEMEELINSQLVQDMKNYPHHGSITCYDHTMRVAFLTFKWARKFNMDYISATRGAMFHDLFLYDWKKHKPKEGKHGFVHPHLAYKNAKRAYNIQSVEKDIILRHMWPLTVIPPKYKESWLVTIIDKCCATSEVFNEHIFKRH